MLERFYWWIGMNICAFLLLCSKAFLWRIGMDICMRCGGIVAAFSTRSASPVGTVRYFPLVTVRYFRDERGLRRPSPGDTIGEHLHPPLHGSAQPMRKHLVRRLRTGIHGCRHRRHPGQQL